MRCGPRPSAATLLAWAKWRAAHIGWTAAVVVACGGGAAVVWSRSDPAPAPGGLAVLPMLERGGLAVLPMLELGGLAVLPAAPPVPVPVPAPGGLAVLPALAAVLLWRRR